MECMTWKTRSIAMVANRKTAVYSLLTELSTLRKRTGVVATYEPGEQEKEVVVCTL